MKRLGARWLWAMLSVALVGLPVAAHADGRDLKSRPELTGLGGIRPPPAVLGDKEPRGTVKITMPADEPTWYLGTAPRVEWSYTWNGGAGATDTTATLWKDGVQAAGVSNTTRSNGLSLRLPVGLPEGQYSLHVTNDADQRIVDTRNVVVKLAKVSFTTPKRSDVWKSGEWHEVSWTYEGSPPPLDLVLFTSEGREVRPLVEMLPQTNGWGRRNVQLPETFEVSRFFIRARAYDGKRSFGQSDTFEIPLTPYDCFGHFSVTGATWKEKITFTGERMDVNCAVEFTTPGGKVIPLPAVSTSATALTVEVPDFTLLGPGRIRIYPKSGQWEGASAAFTIRSPKPAAKDCDIFAAEPPAAGKPGEEITFWGNSGMNKGCVAEFMHLPQFKGEVPITYKATEVQPMGDQRLKVKVPMMPAGGALVSGHLASASVAPGINAPVEVKAIPPVLLSVSPDSGYYGKEIQLVGKAFLPPVPPDTPFSHATHEDLRVRLIYGLGKYVDVVPTHVTVPGVKDDVLLVKLPSAVAAVEPHEYQGQVVVYRVPDLMSGPLPFKFITRPNVK